MYKLICVLAVCIVLIRLIACGPAQAPITTAPEDFHLQSFNGQDVKLSELIKGKTVVMDFWASWCPVCRTELPKLADICAGHKDKFLLIGINEDATMKDGKLFLQKHNLDFTNLFDDGQKLAQAYQIHGFPTTLIIDAAGQIMNNDASLEQIEALVAAVK